MWSKALFKPLHYTIFEKQDLEENKTQKKNHLDFNCSPTKAGQSVPQSSLNVQKLLWPALCFNSKGGIATINVGAVIIK